MQETSKKPALRFAGFNDAWEQRKLGEIAEIVGGGTPSTSQPSYWDGDIDWYAPAEMEGQRYAVGSVRKITDAGLQNSSAKILPADKTVLFTSRAGIGKMAILKRPGATNQGFQSMILKDDYNPYFIYQMYLFSSYGVDVEKMVFNVDDWKKRSVIIPKLEEQTAIVSFFSKLDNLITLHQREQIAEERFGQLSPDNDLITRSTS